MYNWSELHKTNKLHYLIKKGYGNLSKKQIKLLNDTFIKLQREFVDVFGLNDTIKRIYDLKRDIQILKIEVYIEGDRTRIPFIKMKESEMNDIISGMEKNEKVNFKAHIEKFMGFKIDERTTTVFDYHNYINYFNEHLQEIAKHGRRN